MKDIFVRRLQRAGYFSFLYRLIPTVTDLIFAMMLSKLVLDAVEGQVKKVIFIGSIIVGFTAVIKSIMIIVQIKSEKYIFNTEHICKMNLYHKLLSNPLSVLYSMQEGNTIEILRDDFNTIISQYISVYPQLGVGVMTVIVYAVYLALKSPIIAITLCIIAILQIIPPIVVKKYMQVNYDNNRKIEAEITDYIIEGYRGFLTIKLYGLSKWWIEQLNMLYKKYKIIGNRSIYASELEQVLFNLVSNILTYGTYGIIGLFVLKNVTDLEIGIQAIALSTSLFTAVKSIFTNIPQCAIFKVAKERVETITNCQEDNKKMISDSQVAVQNVSYSIGNKKILSGVNLRCKANELFIIKGCNGVGKSTLLKLITGLLPYNSGIVTIGNILPEDLADDNFPYKVLYLPQEDTSMSMTAMELYQIVIPSEIDRIDNLIGYWGLGKELLYEKKIEELSGGERKKIFLLLGYILEPEILLLDEPTNSLDIDSKNALLQYVKRRKGTTVIVTHETIFDAIADNIYYMEI